MPGSPHAPIGWYEASARDRVTALLDPGSFMEVLGPEQREMSPHLSLFGLPQQFDDGIIVGRGKLNGRAVLVAAQEGRFMGGAFGEIHAAKLVGLLRGATTTQQDVFLLLDTGGVRLQEANAGEVGVAEILRALVEVRLVGRQVVALIGGRAGCFGGGALIAAACSTLIASEHARIGVSGPEVIESHCGVEEFDSSDRALVWRTTGGKHRYLLGGIDRLVDDVPEAYRSAALWALTRQTQLSLQTLRGEHQRLEDRLTRFGRETDARVIWEGLGLMASTEISELSTQEFLEVATQRRLRADDAR